MESNVIVKAEGDEQYPEIIKKLGLLGKTIRISYNWGKDVKYITGKIEDVTPQFIFIRREGINPQEGKIKSLALRELVGFSEV
jgi:hypothetical protein